MKFQIAFVLIGFVKIALSQSIEEVNQTTNEFENSEVIINFYSTDSIGLSSPYLDDRNIEYTILGFKINALDINGATLFHERSSNNRIPKQFSNQLRSCKACHSIQIRYITINWYNGTYTLRNDLTKEIIK
jgi:hypothetical protein